MFSWTMPTGDQKRGDGENCVEALNTEKLIASRISKQGKILARVGPRAFLILQSLKRSLVGMDTYARLGSRLYHPCTLRLYRNRHMKGIFYLPRLALFSPNLPKAEFLLICIAVYCARDVRSTSCCVMPSVMEWSFSGALSSCNFACSSELVCARTNYM